MKLRENELKVFYSDIAGAFNRELDEALEKVLKDFGYRRWASGWNIEDRVRDLVFTKQSTEEKNNG